MDRWVDRLIQIKTQLIIPLMADGEIREYKVPGFNWAIKIGHSRDGHSCENWCLGWSWLDTASCDGPT